MSTIGDVLHNEVSHIGNLFGQMGSNPLKTFAQFGLGAADPLSAKLWSGITGTHFTPLVNQFGGETNAQYAQSDAQGVNTGTSRVLGHIADAVAAVWGGSAAGGAIGGAFGDAGGAGAGAGGGAADGAGAAADGGSVNLFADAVPGAGGDVGASVGGAGGTSGSMLGNLTLAQKAELGMSAYSLAKSALTPAPSTPGPATPTQLPNGPESQGGNSMTGTGQAGGAPGVAQTLLTGAGGVDPSTVGLGKNTLLGS